MTVRDAWGWLPVLIVLVSTLGLLLGRDWRRNLIFLAVQYVGVFLLVSLHWTLEMAAVKLVTGWMAASALGMTQINPVHTGKEDTSWPEGRVFRLVTASLVLIVVVVFAADITEWLPSAGLSEVLSGLLLIGMGLLQLGLTAQPLRVTLGLLTALSGFEVLYASVESSILVAALLAGVNLSLALVGSYLLTIPISEENP